MFLGEWKVNRGGKTGAKFTFPETGVEFLGERSFNRTNKKDRNPGVAVFAEILPLNYF